MLLALDTATTTASLALFDRQTKVLLSEWTWLARRRHTQDLLDATNTMLARMHLQADALTALAVTTGPGSFTGVRIAISTVKGLGLGLSPEIRVVGVPTLTVSASPWQTVAAAGNMTICALIQAGRGRYNWSYFPAESMTVRPGIDEHHAGEITDLSADLSSRTGRTLVVGEVTGEVIHAAEALADVTIVPEVAGLRRAGMLAVVAEALFEAGIQDSLATLQPLYLRAP